MSFGDSVKPVRVVCAAAGCGVARVATASSTRVHARRLGAVGARPRRRGRRDASWWKLGNKMSKKSVVVSIQNQQPFANSIEARKTPRIAAVALIGTGWIPLDYQPGRGRSTGIWRELHPLEKSWDCPARWSRFVRSARPEKSAREQCRTGLTAAAGGRLARIAASPIPPPPGTSCGNRFLEEAVSPQAGLSAAAGPEALAEADPVFLFAGDDTRNSSDPCVRAGRNGALSAVRGGPRPSRRSLGTFRGAFSILLGPRAAHPPVQPASHCWALRLW